MGMRVHSIATVVCGLTIACHTQQRAASQNDAVPSSPLAPSAQSLSAQPLNQVPSKEATLDQASQSSTPDLAALCSAGNAGLCYAMGQQLDAGGRAPEAAHWYHRACELQLAGACAVMGLRTLQGEGVPQDRARAAMYFERTCHLEPPAGCVPAALEAMGNKDLFKSAALGDRGCAAGDAEACDLAKAVRLRRSAPLPMRPAGISFGANERAITNACRNGGSDVWRDGEFLICKPPPLDPFGDALVSATKFCDGVACSTLVLYSSGRPKYEEITIKLRERYGEPIVDEEHKSGCPPDMGSSARLLWFWVASPRSEDPIANIDGEITLSLQCDAVQGPTVSVLFESAAGAQKRLRETQDVQGAY